jgi:hypothetical protein
MMSRRATGVAFLAISAFLFGIRFIAAAIFGSRLTSWDANMFNAFLSYVDQGLTATSVVGLILGAAYLLWAEIGAFIAKE